MSVNLEVRTEPPGYPYLIRVLGEMADTSHRILEHGTRGDEEGTRVQVDLMRQLRADLYRIDSRIKAHTDTRNRSEQLAVAELLEKIKKSEDFCNAWTKRYSEIITPPKLIETNEGRQAFIDQSLPAAWDWDTDVALVNDDVGVPLIHSLVKRKQKLIAVFCFDYEAPSKPIDNVIYIYDYKTAYRFFQVLDKKIPLRAAKFSLSQIEVENDKRTDTNRYAELHQEFTNAWRASITNRNTVEHFGSRWVTQGITNLPTIARRPTLPLLLDKLVGVPLIIISPGPSLDKNINDLKNLQGKAILVAPAQTALALSKAGIVPNIIVVSDPTDYLFVMDGFPMEKVDALVLGVSCHPSFYEKYSEKIISFNVNAGLDNWITDINDKQSNMGSGGSVSVQILSIGLTLKCKPIILVGQDLALTNGRQYATGAADANMRLIFNEDKTTYRLENIPSIVSEEAPQIKMEQATLYANGYYGGQVLTRADYNSYRVEFETIAKQTSEQSDEHLLLNCTEGGAHIKGFKHVPLSSAQLYFSNQHEETPRIQKILKEIESGINYRQRSINIKRKLKSSLYSLEKGFKIATDCRKIAHKIKKSSSYNKELDSKEKELSAALKDSYFLSLAFQPQINQAIYLGSKAQNLNESLDASIMLYEIVINNSKNLTSIMEKSIEKLDEYIDSFSVSQDQANQEQLKL